MDNSASKTPNRSQDFSILSTCSSVKKNLFPAGEKVERSYLGPSTGLSSSDFMMQAKIEHLEKERIDLTLQIHKRDEKDRDRKLRLEQLENRLRSSEEERTKAVQDNSESREQVVRMKCENEELKAEIARLSQDIQRTNRVEAMDVWKKMTSATRALKQAEDDLSAAVTEKQELQSSLQSLTQELEHEKAARADLEADMKTVQEELCILREQVQHDLPELQEEKQMLMRALDMERQQAADEIAELQRQNDELCSDKQRLESALSEAEELAKFARPRPTTDDEDEETRETMEELRQQLMESETKRRKLHNQLQDLKGNVRVFLRCRPFLSSDGEDAKQTNLLLHEDKISVSVLPPATLNSGNAKPSHSFAFDHVFAPETTQRAVYSEVSDLVQSVLDGYRVCVFSYGQTGSGKTHTMTGQKNGAERGIIPRSVEELLRNARHLQRQGWEIDLQASIVEIYNEELRDLLLKSSAKEKVKMMMGKQQGRVVVSGLTSVSIHVGALDSAVSDGADEEDAEDYAMEQFMELFQQAMDTRATASTGMNETSSRSHLVVMLDVVCTQQQTSNATSAAASTVTLHGGLRLCDLAGSERLDRTQTQQDAARLRETVNINKSLSCLADVFLALSNKASHVPYRNSKLTTLLQDCLSGDGKALMFVNVSPTLASAPETLCSLRFASQVNQVELGKAQKHQLTTTVITQAAPAAPAPAAQTAAPVQTRNGRRASVLPSAPPPSAIVPCEEELAVDCSAISQSSAPRSVRFSLMPTAELPQTGAAPQTMNVQQQRPFSTDAISRPSLRSGISAAVPSAMPSAVSMSGPAAANMMQRRPMTAVSLTAQPASAPMPGPKLFLQRPAKENDPQCAPQAQQPQTAPSNLVTSGSTFLSHKRDASHLTAFSDYSFLPQSQQAQSQPMQQQLQQFQATKRLRAAAMSTDAWVTSSSQQQAARKSTWR